jgi:hypothetical protein
MRRATVWAAGAMIIASVAWAAAPNTLVTLFRAQLELEKKLLGGNQAELEKVHDQLRTAADRLVRLQDDLLRAEKDGEDLAGFQARSGDLRRAEGELDELVNASQQVRTTIAARRANIEQLQAEITRLEQGSAAGADDVSGHWNVAIEPGGLHGTFDLSLDGTIVSGVYELSGGWKGSLRGTYIGKNLRLERIDAQAGFVATYTGRVAVQGDQRRLEGSWESTNLAAGAPTSGSWVATREDTQ